MERKGRGVYLTRHVYRFWSAITEMAHMVSIGLGIGRIAQ